MTIDKKLNLTMRLLVCTDQTYNESCKGCPYGNGTESVSGCKTKLFEDIMKAMTTPATDDYSKKSPKDLISDILIEMGISMKNLGYSYLQEAIEHVIDKPEALNALVGDLYPHVGKKYEVTGTAVERCMRTAINSAIDQFGFEHVCRTLRLPTDPYRNLVPSQVIAAIANMVRREIRA